MRFPVLIATVGSCLCAAHAQSPADPAKAAPAASAEAAPTPKIEDLGGTRARLGKIEFDRATRVIELPAAVNMTKGLLEYVLVADTGKLHESLLSTPARAFDLNVVLLLLNYAPAGDWHVPPAKPKPLESVTAPARAEIFIRWKDAKGTEKTERVEAWVTDLSTKKPAVDAPWVYSGSYLNDQKQFAAEVDGSIVALYLDPRSLLNSPRSGNDDDERWVPAKVVPAKGTPVTVLIKPAAAAAQPSVSK